MVHIPQKGCQAKKENGPVCELTLLRDSQVDQVKFNCLINPQGRNRIHSWVSLRQTSTKKAWNFLLK